MPFGARRTQKRFARELTEINEKFSEDTLVVCEEFQVVFPQELPRR